MKRGWSILSTLILLAVASQAAVADAAFWRSASLPGHAVLIRHALAPGNGDPADFKVDDCSTQRNLSSEGRNQARRIGDLFRKNGITNDVALFSSQWCRCLETATLLAFDEPVPLISLNSFYGSPSDGPESTKALRQWLFSRNLDSPTVLVTHQVNITALTGVYPGSGELVLIKVNNDGQLNLVGTLPTH